MRPRNTMHLYAATHESATDLSSGCPLELSSKCRVWEWSFIVGERRRIAFGRRTDGCSCLRSVDRRLSDNAVEVVIPICARPYVIP